MLLNGLIVGLVTVSFVSRTHNHLYATTIFTEPISLQRVSTGVDEYSEGPKTLLAI